jgi:two-component system phosphate regulon sensor histidine kinase PhoR
LGQPDQALVIYADLATTTGLTVLGDPADLMARWARTELLATLNRPEAEREAASLDADLRGGRWRLDRTAALMYAESLKGRRSTEDTAAVQTQFKLADAVAALWNEWHAASASAFGSGRRSTHVAGGEVLVVWRAGDDDLTVFAASPQSLLDGWRGNWASADVTVALENRDGQRVAGATMPPASPVVVTKSATDTRLPWTLRVAAGSTPSDIVAAGAARRRIIVAVLALIAVVIPATGYLVTRTVRKELALARQQAGFVSAVSHEFRSPLTSLVHLTSLLRSDFQPGDARRRQYYDALAVETDRLRRFVETLLDVGRIQAGAARYHLAPVDPAAVVRGVVEDFRAHAAAHGHQVTLVCAAGLPRIAADVEALGRALWNLLENAAKYSPEGSPIEVSVEEDQGRLAIRVTDHGAGIPASERPHIFDQFFRGAAAAESAVKGTGVGLAIVRHVILGHAGEIRLDSANGAGSTFSILIPACPAKAQFSEPAILPSCNSSEAGS